VFGVFIDGIVVRGFGAASSNLSKQIPLIAKEFPEIEGCHLGSINIKLERGLRVANPNHRTHPIAWGDPNPEVFEFLRISIHLPPDGPAFRAWIYIPLNSPHFSNPNQVEVVAAQEIPGVFCGSSCRLQIPWARANPSDLLVV
jgi:hypothetical protein